MTTSVIPTWLQTYNSTAYDALTAQEAYAYSVDSTNWPPLFESLAEALDAYQGTNRSSDLSGLLSNMFQTYVVGAVYGADSSILGSCDGLTLFNVGGFLSEVLTRSSAYYDDLVLPVTTTDPTTGVSTTNPSSPTSAKMSADITTIEAAVSVEQTSISAKSSSMSGSSQGVVVNYLFQDPPASTTTVSKQGIADYFFTTLHFQNVYSSLTVSPLTIPPLTS